MEMAKVTSKGQITIPVSIRRRLKINEGDKLLFIDQPGGVMMVNPDLLGTTQEPEAASNVDPTPAPAKTAPETKAKKPPAPQAPKEDNSAVAAKPAKSPPIETTKPSPPAKPARKTGTTVGNLDLDSLLDEIRSIGQKI